METLKYVLKKFNIHADDHKDLPVIIPNKGRWALADLFHEMGYKVGAEIGVESGYYSDVMCRKNPGVKLYCIDAWKAYRGYRDHVNQKKLDGFYEDAKELLVKHDCTIIRDFSTHAVAQFENESLDFVFIDANHRLVDVVQDLTYWSRKVRPGGIVAGHDYTTCRKYTEIHVKQAVHAYTDAYRIRPWFVLGDTFDIDSRTYFWVVQT